MMSAKLWPKNSRIVGWWFLLLAPLLFGCQDRSTVRPVTGKITLHGKPLSGAAISFQPVLGGGEQDAAEGMGSYGRTDEAGEFTLRMVDTDQPGALKGLHAVRISAVLPGMGDAQISRADYALPLEYRDGTARYEVKDGDNRAVFALKPD